MTRKEVTVQIKDGLEARPLAMLVQIASQYASAIYLEMGDKHINAKSIMGMMSLVMDEGSKVIILAEGADEEKAIAGMEEFLEGKQAK